MARDFHATIHGGQEHYYNSGILYLLGIIFLSLSVLSIIVFSCGDDDNHKQRQRNRRGGRGISGIGGDGGGGSTAGGAGCGGGGGGG
jgi:hypothetical protein